MSLVYTRTLTDKEEKLFLDSVLDVKKWIDGAIDGKLGKCKGRLSDRWKGVLIARGAKTIPATEDDMATAAFADPEYKNRAEREAEVAIGP